MEGIFQEYENENGLRSYPFAACCVSDIDPGVFVDAAIYPVNPNGVVYLSGVSEDGELHVSDGSGIIMSGRAAGKYVELYDTSAFRRHVGTLVSSSEESLSEFAARGVSRSYSASETAFASGCVFPISVEGVTSVSVGGLGPMSGVVEFLNGDSEEVRVSSSDGGGTLRFDVLPRPSPEEDGSIRRIICVVDGETPFRIEKLAYNVILVRLDGIDVETVCSAAHRESEFEMADVCECGSKIPGREAYIPEAYQLEEVFIPPDETGSEGGVEGGSENAFWMVTSNVSGYSNPISITLSDGDVIPDTDGPDFVIDGLEASLAEGSLSDAVSSKGVTIQVPGLSGGEK